MQGIEEALHRQEVIRRRTKLPIKYFETYLQLNSHLEHIVIAITKVLLVIPIVSIINISEITGIAAGIIP